MKKTILFFIALIVAVTVSAQMRTVKGSVYDVETKEPLIGASVLPVGEGTGGSTDIDGRFAVKVSTSCKQLRVSYVGMVTQVVSITSDDLSIYLENAETKLDEVVVVAFGKQKRESFTGSAGIVKADEILKQQTNTALSALNGKVAGVQITEGNSLTDTPTIRIRGYSSLNADNDPLIIVDGLPYNGYYRDINPNDIESMTVLKDAASNALYGARGANGVIMITTKNPKKGNTSVSFNVSLGVNTDGKTQYDIIDNPAEYYEAHYLALRNYYTRAKGMSFAAAHTAANAAMGLSSANGGLDYIIYTVPNGQNLIGENGKLNPNATLGNRVYNNGQVYTIYPDDWRSEGTRNGLRQDYNVNISGGTDRSSFYASLGYLNNEGICYGSDLKRYTGRLKAEYNAYSWLTVGGNASYVHGETNSNDATFEAVYSVPCIYPLYIRDAEGNIMTDEHGLRYDYGNGDNAGLIRNNYLNTNPVQEDKLNVNSNNNNSFSIQGYVDISFLKDFKLTINGSSHINEYRVSEAINPYYGYFAATGGSVTTYHYRDATADFQQLLNYNRSFGKNNVSALLGHEYSRKSSTTLGVYRTNVAMYEQNTEINGASGTSVTEGYKSLYNVEGYFLRAQYDYDSRYFASASFRRDASSRFHPDHRWGNFWSLGGAWIMSKENWFEPALSAVNMLKLKASYGENGNDGIDDYLYVDTYTYTSSSNGMAYVLNTVGNKNITWETVGNFNAGVEFSLFNSRLNGSVEYFNRKTSNMLMSFSVPSSLGYSYYYDNVGDMENFGVEVDLNGDIIKTRDFTWNVNLNLTSYKNKITYLPTAKLTTDSNYDGVYDSFYSGNKLYAEGKTIYEWYMPRYAGVSSDGQAMYYKNITDDNGNVVGQEATTQWSDASYYDCGTALPDFYGGFGTSINAYGFDLSAQFNYSVGGKKWDYAYQGYMMLPQMGVVSGYNIHRDALKGWSETNTDSCYPRWQMADTDDQNATSTSDRWLTDASYLALRNVTLGYTLPKRLTRKFFVENLRVYFTCNNVAYWSKRQGFDPRTTADTVEDTGYSPIRTYTCGLNIQF